ncbi:MAG: hypothetical protein M1830_002244 [Pleopsidium flavum]|nr:MAG: hypothetical protein M1830_002244 [Pleopsidium flavum]
MFSYLHGMRINQRRTNSPSTSAPPPLPPQAHPVESPLQPAEASTHPPPPRLPENDNIHSNSLVSPLPPVLPPIPRVAARYEAQKAPGEGSGTSGTSAAQWFGDGQLTPASSQGHQHGRSALGPSWSHQDHGTSAQNANGTTSPMYDVPSFRPRSPSRAVTAPVPVLSVEHPSLHQPYYPTTHVDQSAPQSRSPQPSVSTTQHPRSAKTKLNLLNPMSLLARRRSSQLVSQLSLDSLGSPGSLTIPGMRLPDDYDPRIRGSLVHDFSAPRPRRDFSSKDTADPSTDSTGSRIAQSSYMDAAGRRSDNTTPETILLREQSTPEIGDGNPKIGEREHMPVFKEHFGDDVRPWSKDQGALSAERIALTLSKFSIPEPDREAPPLPPFAKNLPLHVTHPAPPNYGQPKHAKESSLAALSESLTLERSSEHSSTGSSPLISPPKSRSRTASITDSAFQSHGLPKHFASNASRFSFDLAGIGSAAQEKLLEEKHTQKAIMRKSTASAKIVDGDDSNMDAEEDEDGEEAYVYYDMDVGDSFEERVPGINADSEDCHPLNPQGNILGSQITLLLESAVRNPTSLASPGSAEANTSALEVVISKESMRNVDNQRSQVDDGSTLTYAIESPSMTKGFGLPALDISDDTQDASSQQAQLPASSDPQMMVRPPTFGSDYDDLYFDDGAIAHPQETDAYGFDESVFDDETSRLYGRSLRKLEAPPLNLDNSATSSSRYSFVDNLGGQDDEHTTGLESVQPLEPALSSLIRPSDTALGRQPFPVQQQQLDKTEFSQTAGLTQDNLAAYHDALAYATHQATVNGKLARKQITLQKRIGEIEAVNAQVDGNSAPGLVPCDKRVSQPTDNFPLTTYGETTDEFDYADAMEDDPIIAAANAEALENDDEDFYGQEFGFYAQANGSGEAQYVNGGYFGPRDGIIRSHSGRVNFQEPSLTPITERSEFSNRNSMISLGMYGAPHLVGPSSTASLPSPANVQLADIMHLEEDDLSLSALMKLRRGAWGGSNASLHSSAGSQVSGSPLTYHPPLGPGGIASSMGPMGASSYSLVSSNGIGSDEGSLPSSPTVTLQTHGLAIAIPVQTDKSSGSDSSPIRRSAAKGKGHKRNSSGADSVSYIKEKNEEGAATWVLEKRRTAESGQVEIVGRELVMGGRI